MSDKKDTMSVCSSQEEEKQDAEKETTSSEEDGNNSVGVTNTNIVYPRQMARRTGPCISDLLLSYTQTLQNAQNAQNSQQVKFNLFYS